MVTGDIEQGTYLNRLATRMTHLILRRAKERHYPPSPMLSAVLNARVHTLVESSISAESK